VSLGIEIDQELLEQMARLCEIRGDAVHFLRVSSRTALPVIMLLSTHATTNLALATTET
jgi:ribosomal protein S12 methylthiotransferase accessory factor YcaO